ncbi:hydroxyacid dehydrogenase [Phyllobacterium sp. SB3]|uniref:hydroxyacid dehydrogenase n=1 Tax=Phyllobacterium sp. SB3 TaxID=3156073 RepID=UPI0032AED39F
MSHLFKIFIMPHPRSLNDVFDEQNLQALRELGEVIIHEGPELTEQEFSEVVMDAHVIMGVFDMPAERLARCKNLRAFINSEGNFLPNIDYDYCFRHGIRVLSASHVFAEPVAEISLAMAIDLGRGITRSDRLMRQGIESYGFAANSEARVLFNADVGLVGFGDLARSLLPLLKPFNVRIKVYDPWIPKMIVEQAGCTSVPLDEVLQTSTFIFILAGVTADNEGFLGEKQFALMQQGTIFLLLSRAAVVDFPAMLAAAASGRIRVATDVFPVEPVPADDPVRQLENTLLSPHQAGALEGVLKQMGRSITADIALISRGLPPMICKAAQPETASRFRSMPVSKS